MDKLDIDIDILKKQRHDFMNDIQIIYGYLQLDKKYETCKYIEKLCEQNKVISDVYSINNNHMALCIEKVIRKLWSNDKDVILEHDAEISLHSLEHIRYMNTNPFDYISDRFENSYADCVYIYIYEDAVSYSILFCDSCNFIKYESCKMYMSPVEMFASEYEFELYKIDKFDITGYSLVFKKNER